jgi:hypothetical protein
VKYKQRGYQEDDQRDERQREHREHRPKRDPDMPGGRLSDPQRVVRALKCHRCGRKLPLELDARGVPVPIPPHAECSGCGAAIHACRNCVHFDPDAHLECKRPIKTRYRKDVANDCEWFDPKVVVEMTRDESRSGSPPGDPGTAAPKTVSDARKAFEDLFK